MYVTIDKISYPCSGRDHNMRSVRVYLEVEPPDVISGEIGLYRDDGFKLASYDTHDFLRTYNVGNTVVLDNDPEPTEPEPNDDSEMPLDQITLIQLAIAELAEAQEATQTATELALAELAEMLLGGES